MRPSSPERRRERGQVFALTAVLSVVILALAGFVLDVGSWFREQRHTQQVADASALAGAQALPGNTSGAKALALQYADQKNSGTVDDGDVQFSTYSLGNDTIQVTAHNTAHSFFARVLGFGDVNVTATATARAYDIGQAEYAAPFGVYKYDTYLTGQACGQSSPCFGPQYDRSLSLQKNHPAVGAFDVLNLNKDGGAVGQQTLSDWITKGYPGYMDLDWYQSDPGAKFNPNDVGAALQSRIGSDLLLPVFDAVRNQGNNYQYNIVGWVGFHLTGYTANGNNGSLEGYFTKVVWAGTPGSSGSTAYGVVTVRLVN
jgi:hypothetical protein